MAPRLSAARRRPARVPDRGRRQIRARSRESTASTRPVRRQVRDRVARVRSRRPGSDRSPTPGPIEPIELRCRRLVARVHVLLYATPEPPGVDAPLLVVHDGPEYAKYAGLTRFLDVMSWEERIPPMRAALIQPVDRNETYSASALYAGALVRELLPQIAERAPHGKRIGMGASLGALAMLHAQRRHPKCFDGLFLQSGSFFRRRWDKRGVGLRPLPADHAVRRRGAARHIRRASRACHAHVWNVRGEPPEQPRDGIGARRPGLRDAGRGDRRRAHVDVLARCVRSQPALVDRGGVVTRRAIEIDGGVRARLRALRPPGRRVPVRGR